MSLTRLTNSKRKETKRMISVEGLKVEFGVKPLFSNVNFVINDRDRIALVGKTEQANLPC